MTKTKDSLTKTHKIPLHWQAFLIALVGALAFFLPFLIMDKGYFIYYGDFNVQQIPFYKLAHEAVRSGNIFWNWYTDLGTNFIGSYSFYLLFSPFFWLTLPFPTSFVPYLMAPLLILKTAFSAMTAYLYIKRFVKNKNYAVITSLLYAFSGWMSFNIFFNHFHDVAVFFPLLLIGLEKLVTEEKVGLFAVAVAVNAAVNYWFFIGEVVFVILYIIVRSCSKGWRMSPKRFLHLAIEAVIGALMAMAVLLPSALALMGNPRTGVDELYSGWGFWLYYHHYSENGYYAQRLFAIIQSFFFPPDLPAMPNFFPGQGAKWASLSAWLPMFGLTGVFAYFNQRGRKKDWIRRIIGLCAFFSLIPGLNSIFILFNNSYYARWFFMPILIMCVATARALENSEKETASFHKGIKWVLIITTIFAIACGLTPMKKDDSWVIGLADKPYMVWIWFGIVLIGFLYLIIMLFRFRQSKNFNRYITLGVVILTVGFNIFYMFNGKNDEERSNRIINTAIKGREQIFLPDEDIYSRSDVYKDTDNLLMFWNLPNIQAFHSIVPVSIMEFYPSVGVKRDVGSRPEPEYYAVRSLLSTRWLFIQWDKEVQNPIPDFTFYKAVMDYNIYENDNYIPMGFTYDKYVNNDMFEGVAKDNRANLLLRAIHLDNESIERNKDILDKLEDSGTENLNKETFGADATARKEHVADTFVIDKKGFTATTSFDKERLIFFSVPFEKGWSATVNGEAAQIEKANIGFMAVRVPAGESTIRFDYMTPGLKIGIIVSAVGLGLLIILFLTTRKSQKESGKALFNQKAWLDESTKKLSWDEFLGHYNKKQRIEIGEEITNRSTVAAIDYSAPEILEIMPFLAEDTIISSEIEKTELIDKDFTTENDSQAPETEER